MREKDGTVIVKVVLQPRASRDEVLDQRGDCLKVRVTAPPVDNQANIKLCELLAKLVGVGKKQVAVISGHKGRVKQVKITRTTLEEVKRKLLPDH
ncbi:MAG: DUF167 family protein, partial [Thermodesulfobacteriota bacterium]|nr:DUF167 family protein [Thermodesulfobacteriota bacterium]